MHSSAVSFNPCGPNAARYTAPCRAISPWLVQMLLVAFSRRMCCSRVCSVSTQQRLPWRSVVWPTSRPGILRTIFLAAGEQAQIRPAVAHRIAQALPLGDRDVGPVLTRPFQQAQADRVEADDEQSARVAGDASPAPPASSRQPKKFGCCTTTHRVLSSTALFRSSGIEKAVRASAASRCADPGWRGRWPERVDTRDGRSRRPAPCAAWGECSWP